MVDLIATSSEVKGECGKIDKALAFVDQYIISTDADFTFAGELLRDAKSQWKRLDARRKEITAPLLQAKQSVDALFRPALESLSAIESRLKLKIGTFTAAQERARHAAMERSAQEYASGGTPTEIIPRVPEAAGVSVRPVWTFEITDPDMVPREFCSPDDKKIQGSRDWSAYTEQFPPPPMPGVRFYIVQAVRARTS